MPPFDPVARWITTLTGRTLDQHAADPVPAAAQLPGAAQEFQDVRSELLLGVDRLRTVFINEDDLTCPASDLMTTLRNLAALVRQYRQTRHRIDTLVSDRERTTYAEANPGRAVRRRYVNPGDTVLIVLPHTDACRSRQLAGRFARVLVATADVQLDAATGAGQVRLSHADAGVHRDPADGLYILRPPATSPTPDR